VALGALLALPAPAAAAPEVCTEHNANPQGITATHLLAKINGTWVEPSNVCVGLMVEQRIGLGGLTNRALYLQLQNTVDAAFPETAPHLPAGTLISVGIRRPSGVFVQSSFGRLRGAIVLSDGAETVVQARTVPWDYHGEAYFGGPGLDCSLQVPDWQSTFTAYITLNPLNPNGTPNLDQLPYAGAFYESNTVGPSFPRLLRDGRGRPTGFEVTVSGCGDDDPNTLEGFFDGFTPLSWFHGLGITDELLRDASVLQRVIEVRDLRTNAPVNATFSLVRAGELSPEPVPGVALPAPSSDSEILGVRTTSSFSYSERVLLQRGSPRAMRRLRKCRSKGGRPAARHGRLVCIPDRKPPRARLVAGRPLRLGKPVWLLCNEPCTVVAGVTGSGTRLAKGRRKRARAGRVMVPLKLTAAGRRSLASGAPKRLTLRIAVSDRAGNTVRLKRRIRTS
jgi:hypothetical protein